MFTYDVCVCTHTGCSIEFLSELPIRPEKKEKSSVMSLLMGRGGHGQIMVMVSEKERAENCCCYGRR